MRVDCITQVFLANRIRGSQEGDRRKALRRQQLTESQYITGRNNSTRNRWLFRTAASSTSFDSFTDVNCDVRL
ncbi:hypothetical protein T08_7947 [Trichinella sp. T8]|nr:hypothetical protein T08_7947 [Trichinella sp. T8]